MDMTPNSHAEQSLMPLSDLLTSEEVNEVVINPDGRIWVENAKDVHMKHWQGEIPAKRLKTLGSHLAGETKNRLGPEHPIVSGRVRIFGQSMRVQVIVPPAIEEGVSVSIRKYVSRVLDPSEIGFLTGAMVKVDDERQKNLAELTRMAEAGELQGLLKKAIHDRLNILVAGGTSSGKTTLARALLSMSDPEERYVTIEDAPELHLPHPNTVPLIADRRPNSERSPARLLESSLRMRPDRLILGEIRGEEAFNFLEAINTGHPGSISTIHADSPSLALERLAMMVMRAGMNQTRRDVIEYACQTIDLIIQVGRRDGKRGILEIHRPSASHDQQG